ncbi:MAG: hypothetical protein FD141_490 [Fusobacteria bacterium]|nr:MAG: hypothetical protein FD141_490 [Fusobacteriota bacterium]KAF0228845.1 MAG: hypothetical protein FD182_1101 [Fusobacteriota bacterium]
MNKVETLNTLYGCERMLDKNNKESMEKYSSAVSLSDMEIFIFPELMFSLVLANIMSPVIWKWKEDPWFKNIETMNLNKKLQRIKQFIMNQFDFNLDLDTWGMTTKDKELKRFDQFVDLDTLKQSNALFGYEGDKYYFDIDIRKHFGLDKYTSEAIPYWKTETIESMTAFHLKEGYHKGAGECVSLSTMYYAALYIIGGLPMEDIYMIATPLHSQNFVDVGTGQITNNRRLVTKNMWFNGTEISMKSRRAIENEQITFVANNLGYVHRIYKEATMPKETYLGFKEKITDYLETKVDYTTIASYLRNSALKQMCFQFEHEIFGKKHYIEAEKVFPYEHGSPYLIGTSTQNKLLEDIDAMEFYSNPIEDRINLKDIEAAFKNSGLRVRELQANPEVLATIVAKVCNKQKNLVDGLIDFCKIDPQLPEIQEKNFVETAPIVLGNDMSREEIIKYLEGRRENSEVADLAFLAYRDIKGKDYLKAFMKAALERNPVTLVGAQELSIEEAYEYLNGLGNVSIYSDNRLAQPDEVWNFSTGDGLEKAIALLDITKDRGLECWLETSPGGAKILVDGQVYEFKADKYVEIAKEDSII